MCGCRPTDIEPVTMKKWLRNAETVQSRTRQLLDVMGRRVRCGGCGRETGLLHAYRCYYCGIWFCERCAAGHFGGSQPKAWPIVGQEE